MSQTCNRQKLTKYPSPPPFKTLAKVNVLKLGGEKLTTHTIMQVNLYLSWLKFQ